MKKKQITWAESTSDSKDTVSENPVTKQEKPKKEIVYATGFTPPVAKAKPAKKKPRVAGRLPHTFIEFKCDIGSIWRLNSSYAGGCYCASTKAWIPLDVEQVKKTIFVSVGYVNEVPTFLSPWGKLVTFTSAKPSSVEAKSAVAKAMMKMLHKVV